MTLGLVTLLDGPLAFSQTGGASPPRLLEKGERDRARPLTLEPVTIEFASRLMGRPMTYRVILPHGYMADKARRYPVIYLLHGLWGSFTNWTDKTRLAEFAVKHSFIIVTPEGGDGWYTDSALTPGDKWESYITRELVPEIDQRFRTLADRRSRVIAGLSMGGYGSIKFGLKYPKLFGVVGSFSGCLECANNSEATGGKIGKSVDAVMGPVGNRVRRENDIFLLLRRTARDKMAGIPAIYIACGTEDQFYKENQNFRQLLIELGVPHEYRERPGTHNWVFWSDEIRSFLEFADARLPK